MPFNIFELSNDWVTNLYRMGASKDQIGEILGHFNSRVTEHYFGSLGVDNIGSINQLLPRTKP